MKRPILIKALDAVTATTTSDPIDIENALKVSLEFKRADHSSGSTAFTVLVSLDGKTYIAFNKLVDNVTNAIAENLTRVASSSLASNTSKFYALDLEHDSFRWMKVVATETTDGTHSCNAHVIYNV